MSIKFSRPIGSSSNFGFSNSSNILSINYEFLYKFSTVSICDAPFPGGPVDYRQPAEICESHIMRPIRE